MQVCFQGLFIRACITQFILIPSLSLLASLPMISISETKHVFPWCQNNKVHFQNKRLFHFFFRFFIIFFKSTLRSAAQCSEAVCSWLLTPASGWNVTLHNVIERHTRQITSSYRKFGKFHLSRCTITVPTPQVQRRESKCRKTNWWDHLPMKKSTITSNGIK